jgi:hypothetical protein
MASARQTDAMQRSPGLETPKGTEPQGRSRPTPDTARLAPVRPVDSDHSGGRIPTRLDGGRRLSGQRPANRAASVARVASTSPKVPRRMSSTSVGPIQGESSSRAYRFRSAQPLRGRTEPRASAWDAVKLQVMSNHRVCAVTGDCAPARKRPLADARAGTTSHPVAAWRIGESRVARSAGNSGSQPTTAANATRSNPAPLSSGLALAANPGQRRLGHAPSGAGPNNRERSRTRRAARKLCPASSSSRSGVRGEATSRCSHTLKWRPRAGEVERQRCLHPRRSTRRPEDLVADSRNFTSGEQRGGRAQPIRLYGPRAESPKPRRTTREEPSGL